MRQVILNELYNIANFDLHLYIEESPKNLTGNINYAGDLFTEDTITSFYKTFLFIISQIIENKDNLQNYRILDLNYLNKDIYHQLIEKFNYTKQDILTNKQTISQIFEEQVKKTPNNIAVKYVDFELTFDELNKRSNKFLLILFIYRFQRVIN